MDAIRFVEVDLVPLSDFKKFTVKDISFNEHNTIIVRDEYRIGVITDGDVRRGVRTHGLSFMPFQVINWSPITLQNSLNKSLGALEEECLRLFAENANVRALPIEITEKSVTCAVRYAQLDTSEVTAVIMAGGFGKRLGELTENIPKPMLHIGGKPILEHIVENLVEAGYRNILISVHYLKQVIMDYFGNGDKFDCAIDYIVEDDPLGTIGCLKLANISSKYVFLCNGDLFNKFEVPQLHEYIKVNEADFVVATTSYTSQVPYGVIEYHGDSSRVEYINEKPTLNFSVSAGQYIFKSSLVNLIGFGAVDAPRFIKDLLVEKYDVHSFSLLNNWIDIGIPDQLMEARKVCEND